MSPNDAGRETPPKAARGPRVFKTDDPTLVDIDSAAPETDAAAGRGEGAPPASSPARDGTLALPTRAGITRGIRWGALFVSAMMALATLALGVWFARFVSVTLGRDDWVGWTATGLLALGGVALLVIVLREIVGIARLARLGRFRREAEAALAAKDVRKERAAAKKLTGLMSGRADTAWGVSCFRQHQGDVLDPGQLLALADREILAPLDIKARRQVLESARRVSVVTALSPITLITIGFVLIENVRMLRRLATQYGGAPGLIGALRLGSMVIGHLIAAGGVALTDDLLGQFLGQDLLRRFSARLGEGAFNGALTARIGATAIAVIRPLPFLEAPPVRVRDIVKELFRRTGVDDAITKDGGKG